VKALTYTRYGGPEVLELKNVPAPVPRDNEVLVKVCAVSLNDWDAAMLDGDFVNRMLNGLSRPKIQILGSDIAGIVHSVGKDVKTFVPGDHVYGDISGRWGGFAEFVCAEANSLALKPAAMTFEDAAAIPHAGVLTTQGLFDKGKIREGQKVLINGAGGGVGTFAVQIARRYGVEITGVDNASKLDLMRSLGYDLVIDYRKEDFTRNGKQYDLILDTKTNRSMFAIAKALRPNGTYVTVGGDISRLLQALLLSPFISLFLRKKISIVALKPNKDLALLSSLYEEGALRPVIDGPYSLEDAVRVFQLFRDGLHKGKVVIRIAGND
jgi:NADPH:quinone reductase-like Zn-dependent oxidoreductase